MNRTTQLVVTIALALSAFSVTVPEANAATLRSAAMASAKTQKGAKYNYGAEGGYSRGYDCSGLTYWAYKKHGKKLPRTAQGQYNKAKKISAKSRRAGDLIFIHDRYNYNRVSHVGIFTGVRKGKGYILNANSGRTTRHIVGEWPVTNYTAGYRYYATYGRIS